MRKCSFGATSASRDPCSGTNVRLTQSGTIEDIDTPRKGTAMRGMGMMSATAVYLLVVFISSPVAAQVAFNDPKGHWGQSPCLFFGLGFFITTRGDYP